VRLRRLLFGSIATALLWQTMLISILPMLVVAAVAVYASNALVKTEFADRTSYVASTATNSVLQKATVTTNAANLLAEFPNTRDLIVAGDNERLNAFLIPMKPRLGVDVLNVADPSGTIVAAAQDSTIGKELPLPLLRRANAHVQLAWVLFKSPEGIVLHAISPVRNSSDDLVGMVDVGVLLGPSFLRSIQPGSNVQLALAADNQVTASTLALDGVALPPYQEVDAQPGDKLTRTLTVGGKRYLSTFALLSGSADNPVTLAVFVPLAPVERVTRTLWILLSVLGLALTVAAAGLTLRSARSIITPFKQLVATALRIQKGDLGARVRPTEQREMRVLEESFNTMIESLGERERELLHIASHDPLTGLPNRKALELALTEAVTAAVDGRPSTLLYMDLDQFKVVNDTLGHGSGDRLLKRLAELVRSVLRSQDLFARLGGDEFAALLPGLHVEDARQMAERIRQVVDEFRFIENGQGFALGISIGITGVTGTGSAGEMLGQADIACYTAKSEGRNRVAVYEPDTTTLAVLSGDGRWTVELKDALHEHRLHLVFQPVMQVTTECIDHYETLIRLQDREGNVIGPAAFIPAAERSGLIRDIDHWVLTTALDRIRQEELRGNPVHLAINLSGITLSGSEAARFIRQAIETAGVNPSNLVFEITETALMTNLVRVKETIEAVGRLGCHFALDDFGSGVSSFTYLAQLPVHSVKIDGSFVRDLSTNPVNQAIVRAIANVTHSIGKQVVAESVEDAGALSILRDLHVELVQGYYIGRPSRQLLSPDRLMAARERVSRAPDESTVAT
jgi:diguanylate cyclase (GGDEF)-like protein